MHVLSESLLAPARAYITPQKAVLRLRRNSRVSALYPGKMLVFTHPVSDF